MFLNVGDVTKSDFSSYKVANVIKVKIKEIDGHNVRIEMIGKPGSFGQGWLQILPDGKIKYGAILYKHPIPVAFGNQHALAAFYRGDITDTCDYFYSEPLLKTGIPTFGLMRSGKPHTQLQSLDKIKDWLVDNGEDWDRSEPMLACPEDQFKELLKKFK